MSKAQITVGDFTYGHNKLNVRQWGEGASLTIGKFCSIADYITIFLGGNHRTDWITTYPFGHIHRDELGGTDIVGHPATNGNVIIGNDVWIGSGATIMSGISIGHGAVIAANSTVIKNVQPYEIVGGNPAKHIKFRFTENIRHLLLDLSWWDLPTSKIIEITKELSTAPNEEVISSIIRKINND